MKFLFCIQQSDLNHGDSDHELQKLTLLEFEELLDLLLDIVLLDVYHKKLFGRCGSDNLHLFDVKQSGSI